MATRPAPRIPDTPRCRSRLDEIKPEMIAEATKAARAGAQQFAADSGSSVGAIRQANQGVFTIGPRAGVGAALGDGEIEKLVRVVSTIEFFLTERSEEHTSELQSLMRISYAVFCLKNNKKHIENKHITTLRTTNNQVLKH